MPFNHTTEMPNGSSSIEISIDDRCLKVWQQHVSEGKCSNQIHYIGRSHVKELIEYLSGALIEIEMQTMEVAV